MDDSVNEWENRYQTGSTGWDRGFSSNNLSYWLDIEFLKPCRILVPGCGNGYEVLILAELGFDVVAIDIAPTAVNNLRKALDKAELKAEVVLGDFLTWKPDEKFDAIFEQTSLCALPPEIWQQYENALYDWLKPEGKVFASFMQTGREGGPPFHCALNNMTELFSSEKWEWSKEYFSQEKEPGMTELLYILTK